MVCLIEHVPEYKWPLEPLGRYEYTQLSLRQTSMGPAPSVRHREVSIL